MAWPQAAKSYAMIKLEIKHIKSGLRDRREPEILFGILLLDQGNEGLGVLSKVVVFHFSLIHVFWLELSTLDGL